MADGNTYSPQIGRQQVVYENQYQQVYRVTADFGTFTKEYFVTDTGKRAGLVVVWGDSVLLVRQYRLLIDGLSWEIPGGRVDDGEPPEAAAVRECLEETGIRCHDLKPLITFHQGLDTIHNPTYLFHTDDFVETVQDRNARHAQEVQEHVWVPLERCIHMVSTRQIVDSFSIIALLSYLTLGAGKSPVIHDRNLI